MRAFETNDWLLLNSMIYRIYTTEDFETMRQQFLEQLKMVIDFDSADFYLASQEGEGLCDPVTINCDPGLSAAYDELFHTQIGVGNRLDGGRRRVKKYLWSFFRTAPAGQVRL